MLTKLVFGVAGIVLLAAALVTAASVRRFEANATQGAGTVIALRSGGSHPTIEFTTADRVTLRFSANGIIFGYRPGDHVNVRYDPAEPQRSATLDALGSLWAWPIVLSALGVAFLAGALQAGGGDQRAHDSRRKFLDI